MSLLIKHIGSLLQVREPSAEADGPRFAAVKGPDMAQLPRLENAWLLAEGGRIAAYGSMESCPERAARVIDARGKMVLPAWCDSHTHIVYAASREAEFVDRIRGLTYEQIAERGGGILNSARKLRETPEEELLEGAWRRLGEIMDTGTGAVEIKSGYGLDTESELKMLRVIARLKAISPLSIKATFLGAHALPPEYKTNRDGYIRLLTDSMIPRVAAEGLADYVDVFCDRGFFTPEETARILEAGVRHGLKPKIHANELDYSGGIQVGVAHGAISVDHLEYTGEEEIRCLLESQTMPTLLPSTAFFLKLPYAPARRMIEAGLPVALASDYNPGSSPSGRMAFVLSLACIHMNMLPEEAINAATLNGACAMELEDELGSISIGKIANLIITRPLPSLAALPYGFGRDPVESVIIQGELR
jgi:imidazolonepropionase